MTNLWSFLLQTLTASGVAALLLLLKALFRNKLPPSWHFAVWGVLGLAILLPAGAFCPPFLYNWRYPLELLKMSVGDTAAIRVRFPFPWITRLPHSLTDWLFVLYAVGVAVHLVWYLAAWFRLRSVLRAGRRADRETRLQILELADAQGLRSCRIRAVPGLPGAFVCGWLRPVLVIPAGEGQENTVLLHELLHLRSRDTFWTLVICLLRSLHWCNPLLVWCARKASADLESRCDQRVLERLEGEERRDYGRILLGMAKDRFARTPGATCFFNGARQLRPRIEAIARFKLYPSGMKLASVCVVILLLANLFAGFRGQAALPDFSDTPVKSYFQAISVGCTTADGAVDAYAKSILTGNLYYRALCAPEEDQPALQKLAMEAPDPRETWPDESVPTWETGLTEKLDMQYGYRFCSTRKPTKGVWTGLLVFRAEIPGDEALEENREDYGEEYDDPWYVDAFEQEDELPLIRNRMVYQPIEACRSAGRWTVTATGPFAVAELPRGAGIYMIDTVLGTLPGIPGELYRGEIPGVQAELKDWVCMTFCKTDKDYDHVSFVDINLQRPFYSTLTNWFVSGIQYEPDRSGTLPPTPGGSFNSVAWCHTVTLTRTETTEPSPWDAAVLGEISYAEPMEDGGITSGTIGEILRFSSPDLAPGESTQQVTELRWSYGNSIGVENLTAQPSAYRMVFETMDGNYNYEDYYQLELVREGGKP